MSAYNSQTKEARLVGLDDMPKNMQLDMLKLFKIQSTSGNEHLMVSFLTKWLTERNIKFDVDYAGNIRVTKGEVDGVNTFYQCICAHMDTVHPWYQNFRIKVKRKQQHQVLYALSNQEQVGCGGDDKCGIFSVLIALERFDTLKAVFFTQEESGLIGSSNIDHYWFDDVGSIIQLDRWGRSDFICEYYYGSTVSKNFLSIAEEPMAKYGYLPTDGLITDSINLFSNGIGISCVNISCGYYQHHSKGETVDINEFYNSILFTMELLDRLGLERYDHYGGVYHDTYSGSSGKSIKFNDNVLDDTYDDWDGSSASNVDYETVLLTLDELDIKSIWDVVDVNRFYDTYKMLSDIGDEASLDDMRKFLYMYYG